MYTMDEDLYKALNQPTSSGQEYLTYEIYSLTNNSPALNDLAETLSKIVSELIQGHIWTKDTLAIQFIHPPPHSHISIIAQGTLNVGECIDDEWFALCILRSLTSKNNLALTAQDADGEFILIHAADHLPAWASDPDSVINRVWWVSGKLCLIPPTTSLTDRKAAAHLLLNTALSGNLDPYLAPSTMRDCIDERLNAHAHAHALNRQMFNLPLSQSLGTGSSAYVPSTLFHHTHVLLPNTATRLLSAFPNLVPKAIAAIYARDTNTLQAASNLPILKTNDFSNWHPKALRTTRFLYAQLACTRLWPIPDSITCEFPRDVIAEILYIEGPPVSAHNVRWYLGAKLVLGLEIVLQDMASFYLCINDIHQVQSFMNSESTDSPCLFPVILDSNTWEKDSDAWMDATEADLASRFKSNSKDDQPSDPIDLEHVGRTLEQFMNNESPVNGLDADAHESGNTDEDSDSESECDLFDPAKFDALFEPTKEMADSDSSSESSFDTTTTTSDSDMRPDSDHTDMAEAVTNLLKSMEGFEGQQGPAAALFGQLGLGSLVTQSGKGVDKDTNQSK